MTQAPTKHAMRHTTDPYADIEAAAADAPKEVQKPCIFWEILGIAVRDGPEFVRWPVKKDEDGRILRHQDGPYIDVLKYASDGEAPRALSRDIWDGYCADLRRQALGDPQKWTMTAPWQPYREWLVTLLLSGAKAAASEGIQVVSRLPTELWLMILQQLSLSDMRGHSGWDQGCDVEGQILHNQSGHGPAIVRRWTSPDGCRLESWYVPDGREEQKLLRLRDKCVVRELPHSFGINRHQSQPTEESDNVWGDGLIALQTAGGLAIGVGCAESHPYVDSNVMQFNNSDGSSDWVPPKDGASADEVIEHLIFMGTKYLYTDWGF